MKYNKSEIMKKAWSFYRMAQKWIEKKNFSWALKKAWSEAKEAVKEAAEAVKTGLRRMHYSEYKNNYADCKTVEGSYDKRTKTIEVLTLVPKIARKSMTYLTNTKNGLCPRCGTYCYGDCTAAMGW